MAIEAPCASCRWGDHSGHVDWPTKPPPGVIGGHHCPCRGECEDSPSGVREHFVETMTQAYVEAQLS
jgi:hypothetical protein